jgi:hypothetical protein
MHRSLVSFHIFLHVRDVYAGSAHRGVWDPCRRNGLLLLAALLAIAASYAARTADKRSFMRYMRPHGLMYTGGEYDSRFGLYLESARYVQAHNAGNCGSVLTLNRLATMSTRYFWGIVRRRCR